ncbi:metal-dependent transcriptional regulator [Corynebacterium sp. NPDC060344]|uniref:metal-dependent transcriptional regulator n=1 Tax=Corynebacterium sp. NPDC060344 TaxID=3347101 RepID=UPI00365D8C58
MSESTSARESRPVRGFATEPAAAAPALSDLSASFQNYLKAMWTLREWSDEPVSPTALAARVGVKLPTASDAVRKLGRLGLVDYERYGAVSLTDSGRALALEMVRRHRLIETFLVAELGYTWDQVHDEAESLEHAVSEFMVDRIDDKLGHPERDPHGDLIPRAGREPSLRGAVALTGIGPGRRVRVERISDEDPQLLQFFADHGIGVGAQLLVGAGAPFSDSVEVTVLEDAGSGVGGGGGAPALPLGRTATDAMWVTPRD